MNKVKIELVMRFKYRWRLFSGAVKMKLRHPEIISLRDIWNRFKELFFPKTESIKYY